MTTWNLNTPPDELERLRARVAHLQRELGLARDAAATERRATVGWLRAEATYLRGPGVYAHDLADVIDDLADAIERGEHVGEGR